MRPDDILDIDGGAWTTPLTAAPLDTVGDARLRRRHYRGTYRLEAVNGFEYYRTRRWLPVTALQIREGRRWAIWMVDDPLHWFGMREAVEKLPAGRILVAGLGLGLMLHHMAPEPRFREIVVVERSPDVASLIRPTLPDDPRVRIVLDDYYDHIRAASRPDGILWDLAVGGPAETMADFIKARALSYLAFGDVPMVQFGIRSKPRDAT